MSMWLGPPPSQNRMTAVSLRRPAALGRGGLEAQMIGQRQAAQAEKAHFQETAPRHAISDFQHWFSPQHVLRPLDAPFRRSPDGKSGTSLGLRRLTLALNPQPDLAQAERDDSQ